MEDLGSRLAALGDRGLLRTMRTVSGAQGPRVMLDGRTVTLLCSNNYLGLAEHPRVRAAAAEAALHLGVGAGASRLVSGNMDIHAELEASLAELKGCDRGLLFGSGYLANTGVVAALAGPGETVLSDELNHASIVDGCRLARAETFVYRHADPEHLAFGLERARAAGRPGALIVTDGVFSMDGDVAPLADIVALAHRHGARVMVDEAHATGAIGPGGRGTVAAAGLEGEVDVVVGTLGKALGSYGAYVCCAEETARYLVNTARTLIFSTAPPPPAVAGALAALEVLRAEPGRVAMLARNARTLRAALGREGLEVAAGQTQIVPLVVGPAAATVRACERALGDGVFAQAIRPPTVSEGTSRLRLTAMATHSGEELRTAARVLAAAVRAETGVPVETSAEASQVGASAKIEPADRATDGIAPARRAA